jgi:hypothetical protein
VHPAQGRGFTPAEHQLNGPPAAIVSDRYWRTRLGADPEVLTRQVRLGDRAFPIVGVMPPTFAFLDRDVDWWVPEFIDAPWSQARQFNSTATIGRLRPGVTIEQARSDLERVQSALARAFPQTDGELRPLPAPPCGERSSTWSRCDR